MTGENVETIQDEIDALAVKLGRYKELIVLISQYENQSVGQVRLSLANSGTIQSQEKVLLEAAEKWLEDTIQSWRDEASAL